MDDSKQWTESVSMIDGEKVTVVDWSSCHATPIADMRAFMRTIPVRNQGNTGYSWANAPNFAMEYARYTDTRQCPGAAVGMAPVHLSQVVRSFVGSTKATMRGYHAKVAIGLPTYSALTVPRISDRRRKSLVNQSRRRNRQP
jgi:hypothetical protein